MKSQADRQRTIVEQLADLEVHDQLTDKEKTEVINILKKNRATVTDFTTLDGKPGYWGYHVNGKEWHWKLRQTRNSKAAQLFEALIK